MLFTNIPLYDTQDATIAGETVDETVMNSTDTTVATYTIDEVQMALLDQELFMKITEINELCCTENPLDNVPGTF